MDGYFVYLLFNFNYLCIMKFMRRFSRAFLIAFVCFIALGAFSNSHAQVDALYIEETGHWIRGEFLRYYQGAADPLLLFGYPVTDEMQDPSTGITVQYFQRVRFDLTSSAEGEKVQIAPLGLLSYDQSGAPGPAASSSMACRYYPITDHYLCYAFLRFYDANNGEEYFGYPISDLEVRDGRYVQYFERARMEWRPENPTGQRVTLTDLGRLYFDNHSSGYQPVDDGSPIPQQLVVPQARAFISDALIPSEGDQNIYVIAQDQDLNPLEGAGVSSSIYYPDGTQLDVRAPSTNSDGISEYNFTVDTMPVKEIVRVDVTVDYQGNQDDASTWFRIWW